MTEFDPTTFVHLTGEQRKALDDMAKGLVDDGKLIAAGWIGMRIACIPGNASATQLQEMRMAFFASAQHLFGSLMGILDPEAEVTELDMLRMIKIDTELREFIVEFQREIKTKGSA